MPSESVADAVSVTVAGAVNDALSAGAERITEGGLFAALLPVFTCRLSTTAVVAAATL